MNARNANARWDRRWRVAKPDDYTPGLYRMHQCIAHNVLRSGCPLTGWEAEFLQTVAYQSRDLSSLQFYWLGRIELEQCSGVAA